MPYEMYNVIYRNVDKPDKIDDTSKELYFKNDAVTAEKMNQTLRDNTAGLPAGTYLPWYEGSDHQLHLDFPQV